MNHSPLRSVLAVCVAMQLSPSVFAQNNHKSVVFFDNNAFDLNAQHLKYLDSFASSLSNIPQAYSFQIAGHTDSTGSADYNQELSFKRAKAVARYLSSRGFRQQQMQLTGKGYNVPLVAEKANEQNRRVEVTFTLSLPAIKSIGGVKNQAESMSTTEEGGVLTTASGTRITVPPMAFADADGHIVKGKIAVKYTEYRDVTDFLLSDIPMHISTPEGIIPFNSGGMFTINAEQQNKPVFLRQGKALDVGFTYDASIPDLKYYRLDTATRKWTMLRPIPTIRVVSSSECIRSFIPSLCQRDSDFKKVYMVLIGDRYSRAEDSTLYKYATYLKLKNAAAVAQETSEHFAKQARWMYRRFIPELETKGLLTKVNTCKFYQVRGKNDVSSRMLQDVYFIAKNERAFDSIPQQGFDDLELQEDANGTCRIVIVTNDKRVVIPDVTIKSEEDKRPDQKKWIADFNRHCAVYRQKAALYNDSANHFRQVALEYKEPIEDLYFDVWRISSDSIECFRSLHQPYMTEAEKSLSLFDWLFYYSSHKREMAGIYNKERSVPGFAEMAKNAINRRNLEVYISSRGEVRTRYRPEDLTQSASFTVPSLGTYNCDALYKLENPKYLFVNYKTKGGAEIKPVIAYLLDSKLNGMMRYDGSYGMSPYKIAINPNATSRLILMCDNGEVYKVSATTLGSLDFTNGNNTFSLTVEPIRGIKNKSDLAVAMR